jgi:uncharacterized LabA/DUF88 family protein
MELYAEAFDAAGALDKLEGFASFFGADFYGLPRNTGTLTLKARSVAPAREVVPFGEAQLKPLRGGETLPGRWSHDHQAPRRPADRCRQLAGQSKIGLILNELSTQGETNIRRAYGNWKKSELKGWEEQLHEHAIRPMQQFDYSKGKNASDMAMVIDALDLLYTDKPDAFGIVSSDSDFTPLVMHLRAKGAAVYGFGARKTPEPFVNACSRFLFLDDLRPGQRRRQATRRPRAQRCA